MVKKLQDPAICHPGFFLFATPGLMQSISAKLPLHHGKSGVIAPFFQLPAVYCLRVFIEGKQAPLFAETWTGWR